MKQNHQTTRLREYSICFLDASYWRVDVHTTGTAIPELNSIYKHPPVTLSKLCKAEKHLHTASSAAQSIYDTPGRSCLAKWQTA